MLFIFAAFVLLPIALATVAVALASVFADLTSAHGDAALSAAMADASEWLRVESARKAPAFKVNRPAAQFRLYA